MSALEEAVVRGRERAEARMLDTCRIDVVQETNNPETYELELVVLETLYGPGKCRLRLPGNTVSDVDASGQSLSDQTAVLSLPVSTSTGVRPEAVVTYLTVDPVTGNPGLIGRKFRVSGRPEQSQSTANRFTLEALS